MRQKGAAQRARPRLRRLRSAGVSLRDFLGALDPECAVSNIASSRSPWPDVRKVIVCIFADEKGDADQQQPCDDRDDHRVGG